MGSQYIIDPKFGSVLGHDYSPAQMRVGYWIDQIAGVSLGNSTAKSKLGGTQIYGTGADYILPTATRAIVGVRPKIVSTTPTASQAVLASLKVESADLGMKDFEVLANPMDSALGTNVTQFLDAAPWYPLMQPCNGGEKVQFYGTAQVANTVAPSMSLDVLLSDTFPEGYTGQAWVNSQQGVPYCPVQAKVAGINYGGGPTSTGTAAATPATDGGVTISTPKKRIIELTGVVVGTVPAASKPISGQFVVNASELSINPQRFSAEPITGFLGTTTAATLPHLSRCGPINVGLRAPSTPKSTFTLDTAISTLGNFEMGYMYMDFP